jgi:hypothetical protein
MSPSRLLMLSLLSTALLLAACGKGPAEPAPAAATGPASAAPASEAAAEPAAEAGPPPLDLGEFKILSITLGSQLDPDKNVIAAQSSFKPKDSIHASVVSTGKHQGIKMSATWTTADGAPVAQTEQVLVPEGAMASTFSIKNEQPWPVGKYKVSIALEGQEQQAIEFEVR